MQLRQGLSGHTNIAIAVQDASRSFSVSLSLDAGASNCVEVAVGHDAAPSDGGLSTAEAFLQGHSAWPCLLRASWDMLRVTTRGCAPPQESLEVRSSPDGTQLIMR